MLNGAILSIYLPVDQWSYVMYFESTSIRICIQNTDPDLEGHWIRIQYGTEFETLENDVFSKTKLFLTSSMCAQYFVLLILNIFVNHFFRDCLSDRLIDNKYSVLKTPIFKLLKSNFLEFQVK